PGSAGLGRGIGPDLHRFGPARMVGRPSDRCHAGVAGVALAGQCGHEPGETIQHLRIGRVDRGHRHGRGRAVSSHVGRDAGDGLGVAAGSHAEDAHLEAWNGPREHRPAVARVAIAEGKGIDAELLYEGHHELDAEPHADEGDRRVAAPSLHAGIGGGVHYEGFREKPDEGTPIGTTAQDPITALVPRAGAIDTFKTRGGPARQSPLGVGRAPDSGPPRSPAGTAATGSAYWDGVSQRIAGRYYHDAI